MGILRQAVSRRSRHLSAAKRGGGIDPLPLDDEHADEHHRNEPVDLKDPQRLYDRAWAMAILMTVRERLKAAFVRNGRTEMWSLLQPPLGWEDEPVPYARLGVLLGSIETAVHVLLHRRWQKFRDLLHDEITTLAGDPQDIVQEIEWIRRVLRT